VTTEPEHVVKNRATWTKASAGYREPGRQAWQETEISWGIWGVPESEVRSLGDLSAIRGMDTIELGCGTGYVSAWLARLGARPVGIDITPAQLANARAFQQEFGIEFPLIEGNAESVPLPDSSFDLAISEYGACVWCDPAMWVPEAARLLRPGGVLVFLRGSTLAFACSPNSGPAGESLVRNWRSVRRIEWEDDGSVEFHLPTGEMLRLLRRSGFDVEDIIELYASDDTPQSRFEYVSVEWARRWPSEEIWRARKRT
jgi:SAM-dependent methyltransferase